MEALGKAATFLQGVLAVRDGGRAVMVGIAPTGVTAAIDITRIVRRNVRGVRGGRGWGGEGQQPGIRNKRLCWYCCVVIPIS